MNGSILIFDKNASTFRNEEDIHRHYMKWKYLSIELIRDNDNSIFILVYAFLQFFTISNKM